MTDLLRCRREMVRTILHILLVAAFALGFTSGSQARQFSGSIDDLNLDIDAGLSLPALLVRCAGLYQALLEIEAAENIASDRLKDVLQLATSIDRIRSGIFVETLQMDDREAKAVASDIARQYEFRVRSLRALTGDKDAMPDIVTADIHACSYLTESFQHIVNMAEDYPG